jgi:hypothetical protein
MFFLSVQGIHQHLPTALIWCPGIAYTACLRAMFCYCLAVVGQQQGVGGFQHEVLL